MPHFALFILVYIAPISFRAAPQDDYKLETRTPGGDTTFVAVFDGHGGTNTSKAAAGRFEEHNGVLAHIMKQPEYATFTASKSAKSLGEALVGGYLSFDRALPSVSKVAPLDGRTRTEG